MLGTACTKQHHLTWPLVCAGLILAFHFATHLTAGPRPRKWGRKWKLVSNRGHEPGRTMPVVLASGMPWPTEKKQWYPNMYWYVYMKRLRIWGVSQWRSNPPLHFS